MLLQVLILVLSSLFNCNCLSVEKERELIPLFDSYVKIKEYLSQNVSGDDLDENMRDVKRWLDEEIISKKSSDKNLIPALELFTSISGLNAEKCTTKSLEILDANDYLTHRQARHIGEKWVANSKIIELIAHFTNKHAQECYPIYLEKLKRNYEEIGATNIERVHLFAEEIKWYVEDNYLIYASEHGEAAYDSIKKLSVGDPDHVFLKKVPFANGGKNIDIYKLRGLYNRYLFEPCKLFVNINNDGLYESLSYYRKWIVPDDKLLQKFPYRHRICQSLVDTDRSIILRLIKNVAVNN